MAPPTAQPHQREKIVAFPPQDDNEDHLPREKGQQDASDILAPSVLPVTTSNSAVTTSPIHPATSIISKGAAAEGICMEGIYLFELTNLLTHVAFIFFAYMI